MYMPEEFRESRIEALRDLMRTSPLATVVTCGDTGLVAEFMARQRNPQP